MTMTYKCFGRILLDSRDLDPLYPVLTGTIMPYPESNRKLLKRWLLAYWCYYSSYTVCKIVDSRDYWGAMWQAYNESWPRGAERRHFRGEAARKALTCLQTFGTPEQIVDYMTEPEDFQGISQRVQSFTGFGPWIAWKIADMTDRVLHHSVDFSNADLSMYSEPRKGAALILHGDAEAHITSAELQGVVNQLIQDFHDYASPPWYDRPVNIQEVETVLCKYKSYFNGHYPPGKDTHEIAHALHECRQSTLASRMLSHLPQRPLRWRLS